MKTLSPQQELQSRIAFLKTKKEQDFMLVQNQFRSTVESLKPINLLRTATFEFMSAPNLKSKLINSAISYGKDYLTNNVLSANSKSPFKRMLGKAINFGFKNLLLKK